jgi:hypothetical protein
LAFLEALCSGALARRPIVGKASTQLKIEASAANVWARIGDPGDISWKNNVASSVLKDGVRSVVLTDRPGIVLQQRIYAHDDAARSYTYGFHHMTGDTRIPLPGGKSFDMMDMRGRHRATIAVTPAGAEACEVSYGLEIEDGFDMLLQATVQGYGAALADLKRQFEP